MIHLKFFRIIFFLVSFISVSSCISQERIDTLILNNSDTTIIQEYNRKSKLSTEFLYKGNDLILIKSWYYTKKYYGYVIETNDENINSPILLYQYFKNGQLMIIGSYINKKPAGKYKTFYETGQKQCDCNYLDGLLEDQQKKYYLNGQLSEIS
ncbi:MAG: hypothetical protein ABIO44_11090, partial [Saprospiraceae bacterium]